MALQRETYGRLTLLRSEAYQALMAGDRAWHDAKVVEAATEIAREVEVEVKVDVLVLALASLAHFRDGRAAELTCPYWQACP